MEDRDFLHADDLDQSDDLDPSDLPQYLMDEAQHLSERLAAITMEIAAADGGLVKDRLVEAYRDLLITELQTVIE